MAEGTAIAENVEDEYGDLHKIVLQGMIQSGFLDLDGVKKLFRSACEHLNYKGAEQAEKTSMPYVQKVVRLINEKIKPYNMAIRSACCELTAKKFFIFMITIEANLIRMQQIFTKVEIEIFQKCMDGMLRKYENFSLPSSECINMLREIDTRLSLATAEHFIEKLIDMKYFGKYPVANGQHDITLGIRGLREFEPLLLDLYRDVVIHCTFCKMIMLHGFQCPGNGQNRCGICFHVACYEKYLKQNNATCKDCKRPWGSENDVTKRIRPPAPEAMESDEEDYVEHFGQMSLPSVNPDSVNYFEPPPTPGNFMRQQSESRCASQSATDTKKNQRRTRRAV